MLLFIFAEFFLVWNEFAFSIMMALFSACYWIFLVVFSSLFKTFDCQVKGYQPVDVGFQFATPFNLANTLQNSITGPLSIILVFAFGSIMLTGLFVPILTKRSRSFDDQSRYIIIQW